MTGQQQQSGPPLWMIVGPGLGAALAGYQAGALIGSLYDGARYAMHLSNTTTVVAIAVHLVALAAGLAPGLLLGRRAPTPVAAPALGLVVVGDLTMALTPAVPPMIVASLLIGLGGGAVFGTAVGLAAQIGTQRTGVLVALGAAAFVALLFGLVFARFLATTLNWRWVFFLAVLMTLVPLAVTAVTGLIATLDQRTRRPAAQSWQGRPG